MDIPDAPDRAFIESLTPQTYLAARDAYLATAQPSHAEKVLGFIPGALAWNACTEQVRAWAGRADSAVSRWVSAERDLEAARAEGQRSKIRMRARQAAAERVAAATEWEIAKGQLSALHPLHGPPEAPSQSARGQSHNEWIGAW